MLKKQRFIYVFLLTLLWSVWSPFAKSMMPLTPMGNVPYKTFIYGVEDPKLKLELRKASKLVSGQETPPRTINELKARSILDLKNLQAVLGGAGYYDSEMDYFIDIRTSPVTVYLKVKLGRRYRLGAFKIKSDPEDDPQIPMIANNIGAIGVKMGMPAEKKKIKQAIDKIIKFLQDHGKPLAKVKEDRMVVDRASKEMHVALLIDSGPLTRFGNTIIQNTGGASAELIKGKLSWSKGDIYNRAKILETIQRLHNTRLFKSIKIVNAEKVSAEGYMDVYVTLQGAPPSEYIIGGEYGAGQVFTPSIAMEKRNLFGKGESLKVKARASAEFKAADVALLIPDFKVLNLDLITKVRAGKLEVPGYKKQGVDMKATVQYPLFGQALLGEAGLSFEINNVGREEEKENTYRIIGMPMGLTYSDLIGGRQPRQGIRVKAKLFPYVTVFGKFNAYFKTRLKPEFYYPLTKGGGVVLKAWADAGFTPGSGKSVVPLHKLHYPGGYDSVRGYDFQMAGPLSDEKKPKGGRSMMLMGVGFNSYITDNLTISAFMDWGTAYDRQYTDFSVGMLWGIGAGIKYHSEYGDFKLDIASPVRRRRNLDHAVVFYLGFEANPEAIYRGLQEALTPQTIRRTE